MALQHQLAGLATGMSVDDALERYLARLAEAAAPAAPTSAQAAARAQSEAVVEIMFLVAAVDGEVSGVELDLLRKNVRELASKDVLTAVDADALVPALAERLTKDGWSTRMHAATTALVAPDVRRLAYRLGAGVAMVDDRVEAAEAAALDSIAKTLGLEDEEAHAILVEVQKALFG